MIQSPQDTLDLVGFDYGTQNYDDWLALIGPDKLAISSETASATSDRGEYANDQKHAHVSAYNAADHGTGYGNDEYAWNGIQNHTRVAGGFTWWVICLWLYMLGDLLKDVPRFYCALTHCRYKCPSLELSPLTSLTTCTPVLIAVHHVYP
jgi:hypothetical protein